MSRSSTPIWLPVDKWSDEPKRDSKEATYKQEIRACEIALAEKKKELEKFLELSKFWFLIIKKGNWINSSPHNNSPFTYLQKCLF